MNTLGNNRATRPPRASRTDLGGAGSRFRELRERIRIAANPGHRVIQSRRGVGAAIHPPLNELVIVSANLWHDWPRHRLLDERLEAFARLMDRETPHILLLQEVVRKPDMAADAWLAERMGMEHVYTRANGHYGIVGFEEGLAVFSKFPIEDTHLCRLTPANSRFVNRWALAAKLATPLGSIWGVSVHLSMRRRRNQAQLHHLRSWVDAIATNQPAVIGGDFNARENTPQIGNAQSWWTDPFRHLHPRADGTTHALRGPGGLTFFRNRLDYLFLRDGHVGWQVLGSTVIQPQDLPHSDHAAVMARARLPFSI